MVPLWLLTFQFQTNWVDGIILHMIYCKQNQSTLLPNIAMTTKILVVVDVDAMEESVDPIHSKINYSLLSSMMVCIFRGELRNESMDEDKVVAQLGA